MHYFQLSHVQRVSTWTNLLRDLIGPSELLYRGYRTFNNPKNITGLGTVKRLGEGKVINFRLQKDGSKWVHITIPAELTRMGANELYDYRTQQEV